MRPTEPIILKIRCGKCLGEKDTVNFFFHPTCATGRYCLCEDCLKELLSVFPKPGPVKKWWKLWLSLK
jgi:hypothetical protein